MNIPPSVANAGKLVGAIATILGLWWAMEARFDANLREHTSTIIEAHISDLGTRVILQDLEIKEYEEETGLSAPDHMTLNKQLMEKQIEELKSWGE